MTAAVYSAEDGSSVPPLLFPCGNLARDTLPRVLQAAGLRVSSVHCYTTSRDPGIEPHLHSLRQQGVSEHETLWGAVSNFTFIHI